jgi:hypothetical protein
MVRKTTGGKPYAFPKLNGINKTNSRPFDFESWRDVFLLVVDFHYAQ